MLFTRHPSSTGAGPPLTSELSDFSYCHMFLILARESSLLFRILAKTQILSPITVSTLNHICKVPFVMWIDILRGFRTWNVNIFRGSFCLWHKGARRMSDDFLFSVCVRTCACVCIHMHWVHEFQWIVESKPCCNVLYLFRVTLITWLFKIYYTFQYKFIKSVKAIGFQRKLMAFTLYQYFVKNQQANHLTRIIQ